MRAVDLIRRKRDGGALSKEEMSFLVGGYVRGSVPDYQMASFLMAVYHRGMTDEETIGLTEAMLSSGSRIDLSGIQGVKVGKHSTGGVGDKTSIMLCPIIASMGIKVPKLAGRGLSHTGGTIDKLSSIPGLRTDLGVEEFKDVVRKIGCAIAGQTAEIAPADKKLYALRDATATAESVPLIASSIMSKKLAEGLDALLLDVKAGSGALTKDLNDARQLARLMVKIGNSMGVKTAALVTDMDTPLGRAVGNSLEIKECVAGLKGKMAHDLEEVTLTLCAWMLHLADSVSAESAPQRLPEHVIKKYRDEVWDYIEHGDAFKKFVEMADAQHGDPEALFNLSLLPRAEHIRPVLAPRTGFIKRIDAHAVGLASVLLGAGRARMEDEIDLSAGIVLGKKPGDPVTAEEPIAVLHANRPSAFKEAAEAFLSGVEMADREPARKRPVLEVVLE
jgi:pyrimidine-nucleoside phosphorylase